MKFAYLIEPPFNYRNSDGLVTGTDVELAKLVARELGLGHFEAIETEFAELLPGVATGRWRMTTGLFSTKEREQLALFSTPIWALPDGLLVKAGNPKQLTGYQSIAETPGCSIAVIRDQVQHRSAISFGITEDKIEVFETYSAAANAVQFDQVDAYISVSRAHTGYLELSQTNNLEVLTVSAVEKEPAFGSFAFSKKDNALCDEVNCYLLYAAYLSF